MSDCTHVQLLRITQAEGGFSIHYGSRLRNIADGLPRPSSQCPSALALMGRRDKRNIIRKIYPESRISNHRQHGIANVVLDPNTIGHDYPLLIVDCSWSDTERQHSHAAEEKCHGISNYPIQWPARSSSPQWTDLVKFVHVKLLFLFIDVLCIFSEDYDGLPGVAAQLASWASVGSASTLPRSTRPRVVVVTRVDEQIFGSLASLYRSELLAISRFSELFSSLEVVNTVGTTRLLLTAVKDTLDQELQGARSNRIETYTLFSAIHLATLFESALRKISQSPDNKFHFIQSSRHYTPVAQEFKHHLRAFMGLCVEHRVPRTAALSYVASTILLDSFPPDVHTFQSSEVFSALYQPLCLDGIEDYAQSEEASCQSLCSDINTHLARMFSEMKNSDKKAAAMHAEFLRCNTRYFSPFRLTRDCLYCLQRNPEHVLECGHTLCDTCVSIFGESVQGKEYRWKINTCLLCLSRSHFQARLLPPTCGARLISIDGGGSRVIIPLTYLDALEDTMGLSYPIQENFDFGIGTSSGGLTILALFGKYWSTQRCLEFFHRFAKRIFPSGPKSMFAKLRRFFASYLADGQYDATFLEETLQNAYGNGPLFDSVHLRPSGMKLAVTATTISDATLCLFTNYNGYSAGAEGFRCKHLRSSRASDEVLLWEAARCTTAAPWFFKPKHLESFGTFQDGGLKYNNPVRPGIREVQRVWKDGECDIVLSIGTGFKQQAISPLAPKFRNVLQDGAFARIYRASMSSLSLSGENSWSDHWHGLQHKAKANHFRLDLPLIGQEPNLDEVDKMQELQDLVRRDLGSLKDISRALKAASFFFELDEPLARQGSSYVCRGSILSRSPNSRALIQNLTSEYPYAQFVTASETPLGFLSQQDLCSSCGRFQKLVVFEVHHISELADIHLAFNKLFRRSISGFPHSMEWFEERQMLHAKFGRPDHRSSMPLESGCACTQRRTRSHDAPPTSQKRSLSARSFRRKKQRL